MTLRRSFLPLACAAALAACSPQNPAPSVSAPAAASAAAVSAPARAASVADKPSAPITLPAASMPAVPAAATDAKSQAAQLRDVMRLFERAAGERASAFRQQAVQPTQEQAREMVRLEAEAVARDADYLRRLPLADTEVAKVRDDLAASMKLHAETVLLQMREETQPQEASAAAVAQQLDRSFLAGQRASEAYQALLGKYRLAK